ncbi:MAG: Asp23/Gls24 family envelope stress response protein [Defluviitaleaceae bacterium]|nr:Asp23/Gls24 family envelope stress response protein [Defluviitaleaceae bacterium]
MQSKIKNELGTIGIQNEVISRIAGLAAMECYGVVGMAARSLRDGLVHLLKIESLSKGVELKTLESGELIIGLRIIVDYGTNLAAIADTLQSNVRYQVEASVGMPVREVNVTIESVRTEQEG